MNDMISVLRPKILGTAAALIALFATAACDATKEKASNTSASAQNAIDPADQSQSREGERSGEGNEMDARAGMHNEMSRSGSKGRTMDKPMDSMSADHMGMGSGKMDNGQPPADPPKDPPMKDDM